MPCRDQAEYNKHPEAAASGHEGRMMDVDDYLALKFGAIADDDTSDSDQEEVYLETLLSIGDDHMHNDHNQGQFNILLKIVIIIVHDSVHYFVVKA